MAEQLYGDTTLRTGVALAHVGDAQLRLGELDGGIRVFERALGNLRLYSDAFWMLSLPSRI